jgi:hypothetical protein
MPLMHTRHRCLACCLLVFTVYTKSHTSFIRYLTSLIVRALLNILQINRFLGFFAPQVLGLQEAVPIATCCRRNVRTAFRTPSVVFEHFTVTDVFFRCSYSLCGHARVQAVCRRSVISDARIRYQTSRYGICGRQSGIVTGFSTSAVFPWQCHSNSATHTYISFIYARPYR